MANLAKIDFSILKISGDNYLAWALDAELHLNANELEKTIESGNTATTAQNAKAIIFLRHHIDEGLKTEYLTVKDPLTLWSQLKERFDHQKLVVLPNAKFEWLNLRLQDFKSITDYSSNIYRITSTLALCGDPVSEPQLLEKTLSTFHPTNMILSQQYRQSKFAKFSELLSILLVAEKNNELLLKNHQVRPTGSSPLPDINSTSFQQNKRDKRWQNNKKPWGQKNKRGYHNNKFQNRNNSNHQKWQGSGPSKNKENTPQIKNKPNVCFRCGMNGHWSRTCRTPRHLVNLYQESQKNKVMEAETNFVNHQLNIVDDPPMTNNEEKVGDITGPSESIYWDID